MYNSKETVQLNQFEVKINETPDIKGYKRRWYILTVFILYAALNSFQWIEYSSVTVFVSKYYNVDNLAVDWTSIIFMALYPILVLPCSFIMEKTGLRYAALIGCIGTAIGTGIKVLSIHPDRFFNTVLVGQAILSASQVLILSLPPKVAAVWFKSNEVSTACSLGVFGTQIGAAVGFIVPPKIVHDHSDAAEIGADLKILCWGLTLVAIPLTLAVLFYFPSQPPKPPSITQATERSANEQVTLKSFYHSLLKLFKNVGCVIHMIGYGINIGVSSAVGTLLSQIIVAYFPGAQEDAGQMGFVMIIVGAFASILFGIVLDKTRKYKEVTVFLYLMGAVSVIVFLITLEFRSKALVYFSSALMGVFLCGYCPVGFEMAMELTYPTDESTITGVLMGVTQVLGVIFAVALGRLIKATNPLWGLISQIILLLIGTIISAFIPNDLRRQKAFKQGVNSNLQTNYALVVQNEKTEKKLNDEFQ